MLRDEPLEVIQDQYEQKNMVLAQFGEQVSAWTLYNERVYSQKHPEAYQRYLQDKEKRQQQQ